MKQPINIFWYRRDLRIEDNVGLYYALKDDLPVIPIFIFDTSILDSLPKNDARVSFIFETIQKIRTTFETKHKSSLAIYYGSPKNIISQLIINYNIKSIYTNHDYEPYSINRDLEVNELLSKKGIAFKTFKDHVIFEKQDIVKKDGNP